MIFPKWTNFIDHRLLHVYVQSTWSFVFKIMETVKKIQTDLYSLYLVSKIKKSSISQNILESFFLLSKPKVDYLRPFSSSLPFLKFWKQNLMYFGHKNVETWPNCSHKLATYLKYHMPLRPCPWRAMWTSKTLYRYFFCPHSKLKVKRKFVIK